MAIRNIRDVVDAELSGRSRVTEFVKNANQVTTQGFWYDLTGSSGNPKAKQWFDAAPLTAQAITQTGDGGIYHGESVASGGHKKYLRSVRIGCASATALPMPVMLMDYLLYYPSIEDGNTDLQEMVNTTTLPRYTDGAGVQVMAVTISSRTGGQSFYFTYTNSAGVAGRVSATVVQNAAAAPGTVTTASLLTQSGGNPFIPLQEGDTGVRSIESVQMLGPDTGFFALVLVKTIADTVIRGIDAPYEKDFLIMANELTEIQDNAYLSMLVLPNGSMSGTAIRGGLKVIWN